MTAMTSYLSG